ncbi:MAG: alpha/beta hydrolase family protein [Nannocystaceae bacterium]|nr:alpha/beta fold hydrolase [bacterium]
MLRFLGTLALLALGACASRPVPNPTSSPVSDVVQLQTRDHRIVAHRHQASAAQSDPILVVLLHGDIGASYHIGVAERIAARNEQVVAAALVRPGYSDGVGNASSGDAGMRTGDNYTADVVDSIASAIRQLQQQEGARRTLLIGHSGGAAIATLAVARHHGLVDRVVALACPCDVGPWLEHMRSKRPSIEWDRGKGLSPIDFAADVDPAVPVLVVADPEDPVVPIAVPRRYASALQERGVDATLELVEDVGHDMLTTDAAQALIDEQLRQLAASSG